MRLLMIVLLSCLVVGRYLVLTECPLDFVLFSYRRQSRTAELRIRNDGEQFTAPCWDKLFAYVATVDVTRYTRKDNRIYLLISTTVVAPIPRELCAKVPQLHTILVSYSADVLPHTFNAACTHLEFVKLYTNRNAPITVHKYAIKSAPRLERLVIEAQHANLTLVRRAVHDAPLLSLIELSSLRLVMKTKAVSRLESLRVVITDVTQLVIKSMALHACPAIYSVFLSNCRFSDPSHVEVVMDWVPQTATVWLASLYDAYQLLLDPAFRGTVACTLPYSLRAYGVEISAMDRLRILAWMEDERLALAPLVPEQYSDLVTETQHARTIHRILSASQL